MCTIQTHKLIQYLECSNEIQRNLDIKITNLENTVNQRKKLIDQLELEIYKLKQ